MIYSSIPFIKIHCMQLSWKYASSALINFTSNCCSVPRSIYVASKYWLKSNKITQVYLPHSLICAFYWLLTLKHSESFLQKTTSKWHNFGTKSGYKLGNKLLIPVAIIRKLLWKCYTKTLAFKVEVAINPSSKIRK